MRAPRGAIELGVNSGYAQPFGNVAAGRAIGNVATAGFGVGVEAGYRVSPRLGLSWEGTFHQSGAGSALPADSSVRGASTSINATYHFNPYERLDPYVKLGTGYRMMWLAAAGPNNNELDHGLEVAKAQAGLDVRVNENIALGPAVGADLNLLLWRNPEGAVGNTMVSGPRVSSFLFAGVAGRFDVGGTREPGAAAPAATAAARPQPAYFQSEAPAARPAPGAGAAGAAGAAAAGAGAAAAPSIPRTRVTIEPGILSACGIAPAQSAFPIEGNAVHATDMATLDRIASCVQSGPLQGKHLALFAHPSADKASDASGSHASAVAEYLASRGVPRGNISTGTRAAQPAGSPGGLLEIVIIK